MPRHYIARRLPFRGPLSLGSSVWNTAETAIVNHFHARSSDHRPRVAARLGYSSSSLWLRFDVADRYVRSLTTRVQRPVCIDSCVEFFVQPRADKGYFNFEINCGGTLLVYYIEDPTRHPTRGFERYTVLPVAQAKQVKILHTLPRRVTPEITRPVEWSIACRIPLALMERYVGKLGELPAQQWRGNFFKCADKTSHPHWAAWSAIGEELNFHQPGYFGRISFA